MFQSKFFFFFFELYFLIYLPLQFICSKVFLNYLLAHAYDLKYFYLIIIFKIWLVPAIWRGICGLTLKKKTSKLENKAILTQLSKFVLSTFTNNIISIIFHGKLKYWVFNLSAFILIFLDGLCYAILTFLGLSNTEVVFFVFLSNYLIKGSNNYILLASSKYF